MALIFDPILGQWQNTPPPQPGTISSSQSTSTPQVIQTPQSEYSLAFARQAQAAGRQTYNWAGQQYQNLQNLANETIPQFLQTAATSNDLANKQLAQYEGMYMPAAQRFNEMANSYASAPRQAYAMGQAEADATQNSNAAWQNTKNELQSHGIDPSSGMYAGLEAAAHTMGGAAAAGAANQARQGVENTGIGLQEQNLNFGSTEPAAALNSLNTGLSANSAAVNTGESVTNTAANAYNTANNFYQTASQVKLPNSGQQSQSTSNSGSGVGVQPGYFPGSGGTNTGGLTNTGSNTGGVVVAHGGLIEPNDGYRRGGRVKKPQQQQPPGGGGGMGGSAPKAPMIANPAGDYSNIGFNYNLGSSHSGGLPQDDSQEAPGGGGGGHAHAHGHKQKSGMVNHPTPGDDQWSQAGDQSSPPLSNSLPASPGFGIPAPSSGGADTSAADVPAAAHGGLMDPSMMQPHGHQGRPHPPHPYQTNGLPDASTGGHVPYELSPSHGHTTDDVVANLNAGEFVLPRRTVHHMGHKALYDIIAKSDKEMGLHPQPVGPQSVKPGSGAGKAREAAGQSAGGI